MCCTKERTTKRLVSLVIVGILLLLSGCDTSLGSVDLVAENGAFNKDTLRFDAQQEISITFENRDNTTHNFSVYWTSRTKQLIFKGEAIQGPGTMTYNFTTPEGAGRYYFQCDFHPSTMNGDFIIHGASSP